MIHSRWFKPCPFYPLFGSHKKHLWRGVTNYQPKKSTRRFQTSSSGVPETSGGIVYLAILCDLFGMVKRPFQRLSDLQLGIKRSLWITWYLMSQKSFNQNIVRYFWPETPPCTHWNHRENGGKKPWEGKHAFEKDGGPKGWLSRVKTGVKLLNQWDCHIYPHECLTFYGEM